MRCPDCDVELVPLVAGINQCPKCKKIVKKKIDKKEEKKTVKSKFKPGEWWMKHTAINPKWEVAEKGLIIDKTSKSMIAAVICHSPILPTDKYIRLSWFKKSVNLHKGMMQITDSAELSNLIQVLEKIDAEFDENFNRIESRGREEIIKEMKEEQEEDLDDLLEFDGKHCPKCNQKMKKSKNKKYLSCLVCGEMVVLEDGNPIYDIDTTKLPLSYSGNFPVNYYMPAIGITTKWLMAEWKAVVIIYAKENPEKRWLRFYWWRRNLQDYIKSDYVMDASTASALGWSARPGAGSTNVYEKAMLRPFIDALRDCQVELGWD